jgi:hypothetical protein
MICSKWAATASVLSRAALEPQMIQSPDSRNPRKSAFHCDYCDRPAQGEKVYYCYLGVVLFLIQVYQGLSVLCVLMYAQVQKAVTFCNRGSSLRTPQPCGCPQAAFPCKNRPLKKQRSRHPPPCQPVISHNSTIASPADAC